MRAVTITNLQVKGIDDRSYQGLKALAESQNRSVSQEVMRLSAPALAHNLVLVTHNIGQVGRIESVNLANG